jgi:trans-aconitate 2-methyltransferase
MSPRWDPGRYSAFGDLRLRPGLDLLGRIAHPGPHVVYDVGCGPGALTRILADRWPSARVVGTDTSPAMLDAARSTPSRIEWVEMDVRAWDTRQTAVDVIFSNAVLHWVPDHDEVILRLYRSLAPAGVLAFQVPLSWGEPSHRLIRVILDRLDLGSAGLRAHYARRPVAAAEHYGELLRGEGAAVDMWVTRYFQLLEGRDAVLRWVDGTALRPLLDELAAHDREAFLTEYRDALAAAYPEDAGGTTTYPFPRLFVVAARSPGDRAGGGADRPG